MITIIYPWVYNELILGVINECFDKETTGKLILKTNNLMLEKWQRTNSDRKLFKIIKNNFLVCLLLIVF